jgi:hypothetical protein
MQKHLFDETPLPSPALPVNVENIRKFIKSTRYTYPMVKNTLNLVNYATVSKIFGSGDVLDNFIFNESYVPVQGTTATAATGETRAIRNREGLTIGPIYRYKLISDDISILIQPNDLNIYLIRYGGKIKGCTLTSHDCSWSCTYKYTFSYANGKVTLTPGTPLLSSDFNNQRCDQHDKKMREGGMTSTDYAKKIALANQDISILTPDGQVKKLEYEAVADAIHIAQNILENIIGWGQNVNFLEYPTKVTQPGTQSVSMSSVSQSSPNYVVMNNNNQRVDNYGQVIPQNTQQTQYPISSPVNPQQHGGSQQGGSNDPYYQKYLKYKKKYSELKSAN